MSGEFTKIESMDRLSLEQSIGMLNAQAGDSFNVEVKRKSLNLLSQLESAKTNERPDILKELEETIGTYDSTDPTDVENKRNILRWLDEMKSKIEK